MGAWTNEVTITVEEAFDIKVANLAPEKSSVNVGEPLRFTVEVMFTRPAPSAGCIYADIYVNGSKVREAVLIGSYGSGATVAQGGFTLTFDSPGTYKVKAYVYTGPCGIR